MDTIRKEMTKSANLWGIVKDLVKIPLPLSIGVGSLLGASAGLGASILKEKDPELLEIERRKRFYENKTKEMKNENWLSEIISIKKKLENSRLTDDERSHLENKYIELINK